MNNVLSYIIFVPLLGAALISLSLALPMGKAQRDNLVRWIALVASFIPFVLGIYLWVDYKAGGNPGAGSLWSAPQYVERVTWIQSLGIEYYVGVDGISVSMIILSTLISMVAAIASVPW